MLLILCPKSKAQNKYSGDAAMKMLKDFYTAYVTEVSKMPFDQKRIDSIIERFCTRHLISELRKKELDFDPFLNAKDFGDDLLNTLKIQRESMIGRPYRVSYLDNFSKKPIVIRLAVIKEGGRFKIDEIHLP